MELMNLNDQLTVFIINCDDGDPRNLTACKDALSHQDCTFQLDVVDNVAPMNAAFQQMNDRCQTPYYIQVDQDMILHPDGVRRLYEGIQNAGDKVAIYYLPLWDEHLMREIVGVKAYRHGVVKNYPYQDSNSCEVDQIGRMNADGFTVTGICQHGGQPGFSETEDSAGHHGVYWTPQNIFRRYKVLIEKWRRYGYAWIEALPKEFEKRFIDNPTDLNRAAYLGAVTGLMSNLDGAEQELDFRHFNSEQQTARLAMTLSDPAPSELNLYVTTVCNLKCWFCRRNYHEPMQAGHLTPVMIDEVMEKFPSIKAVCFAGFGEPLLNPHCCELVWKAKKRGLFVGLITNGVLLKKRLPDLVEAGPDYVSISLNAPNAKAYEKMSGVDCFEQVCEGIRLLIGEGITKVGLSCVVTKTNYQDLPEFLEVAKNLGVSFIDLSNVLPHFTDKYDDSKFWELVITDEDSEIIEAINQYVRGPGGNLVRTRPQPISRTQCPRACRSPFIQVGVDGHGNLSGCRRVVGPSPEYGHLSTSPGDWYSGEFKKLRDEKTSGTEMRDLCRMCFGNWRG
jgi:MoaA/NifB/PqqE/SkfB family radical SAM enzyme